MIYTAGYHRHTAEELKAKAEALNAIVFDIRMTPWCSWSADWRRQTMQAVFGDRYVYNGAWGNKNYQGGPIEIVNYEGGRRLFRRRFLHSGADNAILLCGCRDYEGCHRKVVAEALRAEGEEVEELDW